MAWNTSASGNGLFPEIDNGLAISFAEDIPKASDEYGLVFIDQPTEVDVQTFLNPNAIASTSEKMTEETFVYQAMPTNTQESVKDPVDQMLAQWTRDLDDGFLKFLDDERDLNIINVNMKSEPNSDTNHDLAATDAGHAYMLDELIVSDCSLAGPHDDDAWPLTSSDLVPSPDDQLFDVDDEDQLLPTEPGPSHFMFGPADEVNPALTQELQRDVGESAPTQKLANDIRKRRRRRLLPKENEKMRINARRQHSKSDTSYDRQSIGQNNHPNLPPCKANCFRPWLSDDTEKAMEVENGSEAKGVKRAARADSPVIIRDRCECVMMAEQGTSDSALMNLLVSGRDVNAGYVCHVSPTSQPAQTITLNYLATSLESGKKRRSASVLGDREEL